MQITTAMSCPGYSCSAKEHQVRARSAQGGSRGDSAWFPVMRVGRAYLEVMWELRFAGCMGAQQAERAEQNQTMDLRHRVIRAP